MSGGARAAVIEGTILEWNFNQQNVVPSFQASSLGVSTLSKSRGEFTPFSTSDFSTNLGMDGSGGLILSPGDFAEFTLTNLDPTRMLGISAASFDIKGLGGTTRQVVFEFDLSEIDDSLAAEPGFNSHTLQLARANDLIMIPKDGSVLISLRSYPEAEVDVVVDNFRILGIAGHETVPEPGSMTLLGLSCCLLLRRRR